MEGRLGEPVEVPGKGRLEIVDRRDHETAAQQLAELQLRGPSPHRPDQKARGDEGHPAVRGTVVGPEVQPEEDNSQEASADGPGAVRFPEVKRGGVPIPLSSMELRLLRYFIEYRGKFLSRDRLLDEVWGYDATPVSRTVDVHVASLRSKVEPNPSHPVYIVIVHRLGYRLDG